MGKSGGKKMIRNNQQTLFEIHREPTEPRARVTDDATSHEAAMQHTRSGRAAAHRAMVLDAVDHFTELTAAELAQITTLGHIETQRRLSDLFRDGLVVKVEVRLCTVNKTNMTTWARG